MDQLLQNWYLKKTLHHGNISVQKLPKICTKHKVKMVESCGRNQKHKNWFSIYLHKIMLCVQGRRRFLKSGTAIERHRRSARAKGPSRGRAREGDYPPSGKGGSGDLPREIFLIKDVCRSDSNTFCDHVCLWNLAYCTGISCSCIQMCFAGWHH